MERCSKCMTQDHHLVKYTNLEEKWSLCHVCNIAFDQQVYLLKEFMKDDFGLFPMSEITKNMILARMRRAKGESPWTNSNANGVEKTLQKNLK